MTVLRRTVSRRDAAIVAAALLVPIPVLAQTGLSVPLPGGLDKGLGSLITLDSKDEKTGAQTSGRTSAGNNGERQSGAGSLRIAPGLDPLTIFRTQLPALDLSGSGQGSGQTADADGTGSGDTSAVSEPGSSGDAGGAGSPGGSGSEPDAGSSSSGGSSGAGGSEGSAQEPGAGSPLTVKAGGEGSAASVSAGDAGLDVDFGADDSASSGDESDVGASVTQPDGSSTSAGTTLPGLGGSLP